MDNRESGYRFEEAETHCTVSLLPELNKVPWGDIDQIGTSLVDGMRSYAEAKGKKSSAFLIDLTALNYMGSAMVALVVRLWKLVKEKNGKMAVVNSDATVLEVLRLSGLEDVWTIVETQEEGLKSLGMTTRKIATVEGSAVPASVFVSTPPPGVGIWTIAAVVLLAVAAFGLFSIAVDASPMKDKQIAIAMLFGGGVLGLIPATVAVCLGSGMQRMIGVVAVLGCLGVLVAGVIVHPNHDALFAQKQKKGEQKKGGPKQDHQKTNSGSEKKNSANTVPAPKPEPPDKPL